MGFVCNDLIGSLLFARSTLLCFRTWAVHGATDGSDFGTTELCSNEALVFGAYLTHHFELPLIPQAAVIIIIWAGGLPVIMNPGNSIAVGYTDYLNANLYFSSWLAFFVALWIAGDLAKELYGVDVMGVASPVAKSRRGKWYALIATSVIVMSSSVRVFRAFPCSADTLAKSPTCRQTKFAISAGVIGTLFAMAATIYMAKGNFSRRSDWCSSAIMVIIWSFGLGFITFGSGPGQNIGNLYFSTWGSFILSVLLAGESYREYLGLREQAVNGGATSEEQEAPQSDMAGMQPVSLESRSFEDDGL